MPSQHRYKHKRKEESWGGKSRVRAKIPVQLPLQADSLNQPLGNTVLLQQSFSHHNCEYFRKKKKKKFNSGNYNFHLNQKKKEDQFNFISGPSSPLPWKLKEGPDNELRFIEKSFHYLNGIMILPLTQSQDVHSVYEDNFLAGIAWVSNIINCNSIAIS